MAEKTAKKSNLLNSENSPIGKLIGDKFVSSSNKLRVFNIQRTCVHDGPGIRTTIFFQGCGLRCLWCQNPEGQSIDGEIYSDIDYTFDKILETVLRDKEYYFSTDGGVTLSGGEPFLQNPDRMIELLKKLKNQKITISVETSLFAPWKNIEKVLPYIDLFLIDFKLIGDDKGHYKLTKQNSTLIHSNLKKILDKDINIKFRMVMVPGLNDSEHDIKSAAEFFKSINYDTLELLKYHNLYESKSKRLNLDQNQLNITATQSVQSLKDGITLFKKYGINATNDDLDYSVKKATFTDRVRRIQEDVRESERSFCIEAAKLRTKYYRKNGFKKPLHIHRTERHAYVLNNKKITVYPEELLVGNFTSKRVAGQLWEEYYGTLYISFLHEINNLKPVSFKTSLKDKLYFYFRIYPFWQKHCLIRKAFPNPLQFIEGLSRSSELKAGFNNNMAAIAHFIVNFDRILELGTTGLIEEIKRIQKEKPENNQDFYKAAIIGLKGLEAFGLKYAEELINLSKKEKDPQRKKELEEMAKVCERVPRHPAQTFHEALQSMLFIQIALCIEAYENAVSFGRLDQILYPYYKKDVEKGRITYEKAKELLCLFVLKIDELILVNDGDTFLNFSGLFETVSTDQAVTFGGVGKDGNDATNDITYMLLDACELQTLSLDMGARVNENSPDKYLERIAEIYITGCPLPQLFSDETYIPSIMKHYDTTIEQARNYSIVGCVEPNASDDHFGNTDCANVNLALPFLQALKGQEIDLWRSKPRDYLMKFGLNYMKFLLQSKTFNKIVNKIYTLRDIHKGFYEYNPPLGMDELLERFQKRLNVLTNSVLEEHQQIEKGLRENFTTPLSSSLFNGCLESGKDLYEGGAKINSSGIQAVGVTDVANSFYALNEVVYNKRQYSLNTVINAIENNFKGEKYQKVRKALLAVPKFGDDSSGEAVEWMNKILQMYNNALDSVPNCPRNGRYSAGYYALNVCNIYGRNTQALPSGRLAGEPLANSLTPHYGMEQTDLTSALNSVAGIDYVEHAENGATVTFTIDSALFPGKSGIKNLANIYKTFLMNGGMQLQPNVINREILLDAYHNPDKHKYLLVRIAGYCAYFQELSEEMKQIVINRTCYSF